MSSASAKVDRRCATMMPVRPSSSRAKARCTRRSVAGSSFEEGSSRITTSGSRSNRRPQASTWVCPAESPTPPAPSMVSSPAGNALQPVAHAQRLENGDEALVRHVVVEQGEVVPDAGGEEVRFLRHQTDALSRRGDGDITQIDPTQAHGARIRIVEAGQKPGERGLAAAGAPDDPQHPPWLQMQRDAAQHGGARFVAEPDVIQIDGERTGRQAIAGAVGEAGTFAEESFDAAETGPRLLQVLDFVADLLGRLAEHLRVAKDEEDRPDRERAIAVEHGAEGQGEGQPQPEQSLAGGDHAVAAHLGLHSGRQPPAHQLGAAAEHEPARAAGADVLQPRQVLAEEPVEVSRRLALGGRVGGGHGS